MIKQTAPDFKLKNSDGNFIRLYDILSTHHVVLFFYPKNETSVCTKEACGFQAHLPEFDNLNTRVIGISGDNTESHQQFKSKHKLDYELLSDQGNFIRKLFGVKNFLMLIPGRETIIISKDKKILGRFRANDKHEEHIIFALDKLKLKE